jgi:hypothetical protein
MPGAALNGELVYEPEGRIIVEGQGAKSQTLF